MRGGTVPSCPHFDPNCLKYNCIYINYKLKLYNILYSITGWVKVRWGQDLNPLWPVHGSGQDITPSDRRSGQPGQVSFAILASKDVAERNTKKELLLLHKNFCYYLNQFLPPPVYSQNIFHQKKGETPE